MKSLQTICLSVAVLLTNLALSVPLPALADYRPLIGINCDVAGDKPRQVGVQSTYIEAITRAGGIPLLLPPMSAVDLQAVLPSLDGVMMTGGDDYPPDSYGAKPHPSVSLMVKDRSDFDLLLVRETLADKKMPFFGVCAGCQALNIGCGGTLTQDIPSLKLKSKVLHASPQGWQKGFNKHEVTFIKGSHLENQLGAAPVSEPTSHHQCVNTLGQGLKTTATTSDNLIEGIEMPDRPFVVGVQFHPERSFERNQALFNDFISSARNYHDSKHKKLLE